MKAVICTAFGSPDVLQLSDVEKPVPKENDLLIRIRATSVNYGDLMARNFKDVTPSKFNMPFLFWLPARLSFGLNKPRIKVLGNEFSGEIEAIGNGVKRFKAGDQVFGYLGQRMGTYAEYLCMPEEGVVAEKPTNMSYEEAAVLPMGAIMALNLLRKKGNIQPGHRVLINGASGGIGSVAVQLAKNSGAEVTGVCGTPRLDFVKSLGADKVIDYTQEDFTQSGESYDLIFDILGKRSFSRCKGSLKPNGRYLLASFKSKQLLQMAWTGLSGRKKVICGMASERAEDLISVKELAEAGKIKTIIDRSFPLEQTAQAHRYVENGHKQGQVAITVAPDNKA